MYMKNELSNLTEATERYALQYSMLDCTDIIVGFSGGADSTLLLYLLVELGKKHNIRITAAHVNHMLRGEDADRDAEFCRKVCERYGVSFRLLCANVSVMAKERKQSDELCARDVRYGFFEEIKKELEAGGARVKIATAHNATDNAETVLFNLTRGTALSGICGIPPVRDGYIIRPILSFSKEQVTEYCNALCLDYVTDATNASTSYTRNKIRHLALPVLRGINPAIEDSVLRATQSLRDDSEYLEHTALEAYGRAKQSNSLSREHLLDMPSAILTRVLCLFAKENGAGYENIHIKVCASKIAEGNDFSVSLIGKKKMHMKAGKLTVEDDTRKKTAALSWQVTLCMGENILPDGSAIYLFSKKDEAERIKTQNVYKLFIQQSLSGDTISNVFIARERREGDSIISGGHTHKVKKLLCDKKIPSEKRNALPVVLRDGKAIWIPGVRTADGEGKGGCCIYAVYKTLDGGLLR